MKAAVDQGPPERLPGVGPTRLQGWLIPFACCPIFVLASQLHTVFNEWGGVMQWFAGQDVIHGVGYCGWTAHFWPPLFSILMGAGSFLASGFVVGKLISVCAGLLLLHTAYRLALTLTERVSVALWTQAFLAVNPLYVSESITAHNHMLDAFFLVTGLHLFLTALREPASKRSWSAGLVCGLACITRTTSTVLVSLALFPFLIGDRRSAARLSIRFLGALGLVVLPWLVMNAFYNGSPIANWQHLNVGAGVLNPANAGSNLALWRVNADGAIHSILGLVIQYPFEYARNFCRNLIECIEKTVRFQGSLAAFVLPGILDASLSTGLRGWGVVLGVFCLYISMVSQSHVSDWHLLPWVVPMTVLGVRLIHCYGDKADRRYRFWRRLRLSYCGLVLVLLLLYGARLTRWELQRLAHEGESYRPMVESQEVATAMKIHDPEIQHKIIMAIDPGRAYYAGGKYLMTPLEYEGSVIGLVAYEGLNRRIRDYAPKYPADLSEFNADYLVFTRTELNAQSSDLQEPRGFEFLLDPSSEKIPPTFEAVYRSQNVVVYEIQRTP